MVAESVNPPGSSCALLVKNPSSPLAGANVRLFAQKINRILILSGIGNVCGVRRIGLVDLLLEHMIFKKSTPSIRVEKETALRFENIFGISGKAVKNLVLLEKVLHTICSIARIILWHNGYAQMSV